MKLSVIFQSAWMALMQNKKRSLLTIIGIVIGIAAVSTIVSIGRGFESYVRDSLQPEEDQELTVEITFFPDDQSLLTDGSSYLFHPQDIRNLESIEGVESADPPEPSEDFVTARGEFNQSSSQLSLNLIEEASDSQVLYGRAIDQLDNIRNNRVVSVPVEFTENFEEIPPEDFVGAGLTIDGLTYTIIGVHEPPQSDSIFAAFIPAEVEIPRQSYQNYHGIDSENYIVVLTIEPGYLPSEIADQAIDLLEEEGTMADQGEYQYFDLTALDDGLSQVLNGITLFIAAIGAISLLIAGIGVMNMMYISVSERTKEIGIRRALGANRGTIRLQFVLEGVMMTTIGGVLGYLFGLIFSSIASIFLPFTVGVDFFTVAISIIVSALIGLVFSFAPANEASKKEIITIL